MQIKNQPILVITTAPDSSIANKIARKLIDNSLAACVQIDAAIQSLYRWKDTIETTSEFRLIIKTQDNHWKNICTLIDQVHPYEVPELVQIPITDTSPAYGDWLQRECNVNQEP